MAHYAKVENTLVTQVIAAEAEFFDTFVDTSPGEWIQTSYNNNIRGRFAMIGGTYDSVNDVFIDKCPFKSWVLDDDFNWTAPVGRPDTESLYTWDEDTTSWVESTNE